LLEPQKFDQGDRRYPGPASIGNLDEHESFQQYLAEQEKKAAAVAAYANVRTAQ